MPRRVLMCRLNPKTDRPYARRFDLDPLEYVRNNRQRLVAAALTILRGWFSSDAHSSNDMAHGRMASFEDWDDLVRQPVAWLSRSYPEYGLVDVMAAVDAAQTTDPEQQVLGELFACIYSHSGNRFFSAKDLFASDVHSPDIWDLLCDLIGGSPNSVRSLGRILNHRRDRIVNGYRLKQNPKRQGNLYRVEKVE